MQSRDAWPGVHGWAPEVLMKALIVCEIEYICIDWGGWLGNDLEFSSDSLRGL